MDFVLVCALVSWVAVRSAVRAYLAWFATIGRRDERFDAWCEGEPIVAAAFCPRHDLERTIDFLRARFATEIVNEEGGYPWPHYVLELRAAALNEVVVGMRIGRAKLLRGSRRRVRALDVARDVLRDAPEGMRELWIAEDFFGSKLDARSPFGWIDHRKGKGFLPCNALPYWLLAAMPKGPGGPPGEREEAEDEAHHCVIPSAVAPEPHKAGAGRGGIAGIVVAIA